MSGCDKANLDWEKEKAVGISNFPTQRFTLKNHSKNTFQSFLHLADPSSLLQKNLRSLSPATILSSTVKNNFPFFFLPDTPFQALDLVDLMNLFVDLSWC
jgi:flagellar biosynthesis protein FliP